MMESVLDMLKPCRQCGIMRTRIYSVTRMMILMLNLSIVLSLDITAGCDESVHFDSKDIQIKSYPSGDPTSDSFYRFLYVDKISNSLLVGGRNQLVKLNLTDISNSNSIFVKKLDASPDKQSVCSYQGKSTDYCQNHIKYIARDLTTNKSKLYVCGTDANDPVQYSVQVNASGLFPSGPLPNKVCPNNPFDNATAVFVEDGNPGGVPALYSATLTSYRKPLILRPTLKDSNDNTLSERLENVESKFWLNEPQFVGSYDADDEVLFFLREVALEFTNCEKKVFSRVAKVCKKDKGGSNLLINKWTSYQKARLNCSIPGEFPNYFDEIQAVDVVNDTVYGLFTTNLNGLSASAICAFTLDSIKETFNGQFKHQEEDNSYWLPVPELSVPIVDNKRPGQCVNDSKQLKDTVESFIRIRPLMDKAVQHKFGRPIFYKSGVQMQKMLVVKDKSINERILFLTATSDGKVYKVTSVFDTSVDPVKVDSVVATKFSPLPMSEPIWDLKLHGSNAYISTDSYVRQFSLLTCDKYGRMVDLCVNDPYCKWKSDGSAQPWRGRCELAMDTDFSRMDLNDMKDKYHKYIEQQNNMTSNPIPYSLLSTAVITLSDYPFTVDGKRVEWQFKPLGVDAFSAVATLDTKRHYTTPDYALVITNLTTQDSGTYRAVIKDSGSLKETVIAMKKIRLPESEDQQKKYFEEVWMKQFTEWCNTFDEAKKLQEAYKNNKCST